MKECSRRLGTTVLLALVMGVTYALFFLWDAGQVRSYTRENGLIELSGAFMFLLASIGFGLAYFRSPAVRPAPAGSPGTAKKNVFYLLLCLFFLLCFLEEVSWGQKLLHWQTPAVLQEYNQQKETNLHNLVWFHGNDRSGHRKPFLQLLLNGDRLFSMFWFAFCVAAPLLAKSSGRIRDFFARLRFPVVSLSYVLLFLFCYGASRVVCGVHPDYGHGIVETKESLLALLFMAVAWGQVRLVSREPDACASMPEVASPPELAA